MRTRSHYVTTALAWFGLAGVGACGASSRQRAFLSDGRPVVIFENQFDGQATVYSVSPGGEGVRIGTVQAGRTDTLAVHVGALDASGSVTIVARLLAKSSSPSSGPLTLLPGDRILVRLPPDARLLSVVPAKS